MSLPQRRFLPLLSLVAAGLFVAAHGPLATAAPRPNIVLIIADDLGYGDLACYGCPDTKTPVLDRLASQGVRFTDYYANAPECTPTRVALMTGRYQQRVGGLECALGTGNVGRYDDAIRLAENHDLGLPAAQNVLLRGLKRAGYTAVGFGKWHLGYEPKFGPLHHGFDHFFGPLGGGVDYYYHCESNGVHVLYENEKPVRRDGYMTDLITDGAIEFLQRREGSKPFFLYLPYTVPHTPLQMPDQKPPIARSQENWNEGTRATYVAMVERFDLCVGKILKTLDKRKLTDDTLVIFVSDNGGTKTGRNAPFSGYKGRLFEGGIREPAFVRWPGVIPEGIVSNQPAIMMDFTISMLRAAGEEAPADLPSDGIDILRHIEQRKPTTARTLFWRQRRGERTERAVRDGSLKYLSIDDGDQVEEYVFDLKNDPAEKTNLLDARPDATRHLKRLLAEWEKDVQPSR